jgi:cell wall-associated NlpC family hydrolase
MPINRSTVLSVMAALAFASAPVLAAPAPDPAAAMAKVSPPLLTDLLPTFNPAPMLAQSAVSMPFEAAQADGDKAPAAKGGESREALVSETSDLRKALITLAMKLRDIRYVRGGRDPSTGFDCSGFVRYVFAHAVGLDLPTNSASQFLAGLKVKRSDMQPGDLVFFRTAGRGNRGRISHVGIYIDNGQFIHSPSHGKTVRVDSLSEAYWAKHFAGAKRPEGIAQNG